MRDHIERLVGMKEHGLAAPNGIPDIEPALGQRKLDRVLRPISQSRVRHGAVKLQEIGKSGKTFSRIEILRAKLELLDRLMQQLAGFARPFVFGGFQFLSQLLECCTIQNIAYFWKHLAFLFLLGMMFHIIVQNFQFCFELVPTRRRLAQLPKQGFHLSMLLDRFKDHFLQLFVFLEGGIENRFFDPRMRVKLGFDLLEKLLLFVLVVGFFDLGE